MVMDFSARKTTSSTVLLEWKHPRKAGVTHYKVRNFCFQNFGFNLFSAFYSLYGSVPTADVSACGALPIEINFSAVDRYHHIQSYWTNLLH